MFNTDVLTIDLEREADDISASLRTTVFDRIRRRGVVLGLSGGIDSSVTCALAVRALGKERVFGIIMPERNSSAASKELGLMVARDLGVEHTVEDIEPTLQAVGCYERFDTAVRRMVPEYGPDWQSKIVLPGDLLDSDRLNVFRLVVSDPDGNITSLRLTPKVYMELVAASSFKQRVRKTVEYYHADRLHYAVAGTPNRLEYDQGFFVKNGDGAADVKPIAHLYKTQVYAMARHLGLREKLCSVTPTTDTYSLDQGQDEFYFVLPYQQMDLLLWARNHGIPATEAAPVLGLTTIQVERVYRDIVRKRATTASLHMGPILLKPVDEVS